ncbi:uncharacterized protein LOC120115225 [Hibiscus syriacus]|nr:uncharacterized protein LOC120115225 [Hibiscus syriacus]
MTRIHLKDEDETGARMSFKGSSDYSCASSVTDDDMYGAKAPNVVARLMGLDSLPTSSEPYSTPFFETQSLRDAHFHNRNLNYHHDEQMVYPDDPFNKIKGGPVRNFADSKPRKMVSNPIEKFRTESLPPKAVKTIPITHHKLLSPIKSPGFFPTKDAAHIMEAAARILEPGPQVIARAKMPLVGSSSVPVKVRDFKEKLEAAQRKPLVQSSSSVPLRVRDLKEKSEAAHKTSRLTGMTQKPVESNAVKYLKGQPLNKSWNGLTDASSFRTSNMEENSPVLMSEGKSISLAMQAKFNVQKREGLISRSRRSMLGSNDESEVKSNESLKSQPSSRKSLHKKSLMRNASGALKLNNQKQNCIIDKEKLPSKPIGSNLHGRRVLPADSASGRHKISAKTVGNSKTRPRKFGVGAMDSERSPYSSSNNPRKKRSIDRDFKFGKNQGVDSMLIEENRKEDHAVTERSVSWVEDSKKGMDVVSFTFTAPLTLSSETSTQIAEKNNGIGMDNRGKRLLPEAESMNFSSLGYNMIGGDALSILLERKLLELNNAIESSSKKSLRSGSDSTSITFSQDPNLSSCELQPLRSKHKFQGVDEMDECSSSPLDARQPSPVSILEPSFSTESCNSLDSTDSFSIDGSKRCSTVQTAEVLRLSPLKKLRTLEADTELSDSASSISSGAVAKSNHNIVAMSDPMVQVNWELEYVKLIVCNVELMFKDFAIGRAHQIIGPCLFDQLERRRSDAEEGKLERKVLFDSVSECLNSKCRQYASGGHQTWAKGMAIMRRNKRLAEEVHKEISRWRAMGDCMVDELVDDDMSSGYGKWLDFEVDAFDLEVDIEEQIMNDLVGEILPF